MALLDVTLSVNGVDYTGATLGSVRVVRGRRAIDEVARAGYCLAELIDETGQGFPIEVTEDVVITVENTSGPLTLFTGTISDIDTRLYSVRTGTRAIWQVIANGPLALLNRRQVLFAGSPAEKDGDLALKVLEAGLYQTWEEYTGSTWAAAGSVTWEDVDEGFDGTLVETPGDYDIKALDPQDGGYNALALISQIAISVGGSIYETGDGNVGYLSAYGRSLRAESGYTGLPTAQVRADDLAASKSASDLVNRLEVGYDGGTIEVQDLDSIQSYGVRASVLGTILADQSAAENRGADLLFDLAVPRYKLPSARFELHTLSGSNVDLLLGVDVEEPVALPGLPATLGDLFDRAFVEGVQYDLGADRRSVTYFLSDAALSLRSERWQDVDQTLAWQDVDAILTWAEARNVTA